MEIPWFHQCPVAKILLAALAPPQRALKVHNSCQFAPRLSLYQEGPVLDETLWKVVLKLPPDLNAIRRFSSQYGAWYLGAKRPRYTEECWEWEDESFPEIFGPRVPAAYAVSAALGVRPERLYFIPGFREGHWRRPCLGWQNRREVECRPELGVGFKIRVDWGYSGDSLAWIWTGNVLNKTKRDPSGDQPPKARTVAPGTHCAERGDPERAGSISAAKSPFELRDLGTALDCSPCGLSMMLYRAWESVGVLCVHKRLWSSPGRFPW